MDNIVLYTLTDSINILRSILSIFYLADIRLMAKKERIIPRSTINDLQVWKSYNTLQTNESQKHFEITAITAVTRTIVYDFPLPKKTKIENISLRVFP